MGVFFVNKFYQHLSVYVRKNIDSVKMASQRIRLNQKSALIDFMCENYTQLFGKHVGIKGPANKKAKWAECAELMNSLGPNKDVAAWQRCWVDLKAATKKKASLVRNEQRQTGGGPQTAHLTEEDLKIINIVSVDSVGGLEDIPESAVWDLTDENLTQSGVDAALTERQTQISSIHSQTSSITNSVQIQPCSSTLPSAPPQSSSSKRPSAQHRSFLSKLSSSSSTPISAQQHLITNPQILSEIEVVDDDDDDEEEAYITTPARPLQSKRKKVEPVPTPSSTTASSFNKAIALTEKTNTFLLRMANQNEQIIKQNEQVIEQHEQIIIQNDRLIRLAEEKSI